MDKKWNLQDIQPANRTRRPSAIAQTIKTSPSPEPRPVTEDDDGVLSVRVENGSKKKPLQLIFGIAVFVGIIILGISASILMSGAEVTVHPRHKEPAINAVFTATKNPAGNQLTYEILSLEQEGERQVKATGKENVTTQATGEITIKNTSKNPERLIKNTRFATPNGLVFRITESAVVPGAVMKDGKSNPGTIKASIFADQPGDAYNLPAGTTFTVPGFKENNFTELFAAITAENTTPFTGGYKGEKFMVDETEMQAAKQALQTELRNALLDKLPGEKPSGMVLFDSAVTFTYQTLPAVEYGENLAIIKEKARLQIPLFKEADFARFMAAASIPKTEYTNEPVRIENYKDLIFSYNSATTSSSDLGNVNEINFKIVGNAHIIWTFDAEKLKADLAGANKKTTLPSVLGAYPAIERAEAIVRPFWKRSFPKDASQITVTEELLPL